MSQSQASNHHDGVSCDGCMTPNFTGNRYKCLRCFDFDLCHACYTANRFHNIPVHPGDRDTQQHSTDHPVQCILSHRDFDVLYDGDSSKSYEACKIIVFTCPYCNRSGFNHRTFTDHISSDHGEAPNPPVNVNCPLCIACPEFDANREVDNLYLHWTNMHSNFDPGFRAADGARTINRRPQLARRTARQPAGNAQNPRRANPRTLQRLYAEVLAENPQGGIGVVGAAAQAAATFGLPWTSDLTDVDEMFRMVGMNRNLPTLPTNTFPTAADAAARLAASQLQTLTSVGGAGMLSSLRAATSRAGAGSVNEYAAPSSARTTSVRQLPTQTVQVMRAMGTTPIYPAVCDDQVEEDATIGHVGVSEYDLVSGDDTSDGEDEYESAGEENDGEERQRETERTREEETKKTTESSKGTRRRARDSEFEFDRDDQTDSDDEQFTQMYKVEGEPSHSDMRVTNPIMDPSKAPDAMRELRLQTTPAEWAEIMHVAGLESESESEEEERADTPRAVLAGSSNFDERDPQCWLTVGLDTSQLTFANPTQYWTDKRFLRQRKLQRELSVVSDLEQAYEQSDVAEALMRAGVPFALSGRELDTTGRSIRRAMRSVNYDTVEGGRRREQDALIAASRRLESESERVDSTTVISGIPSTSTETTVAPPTVVDTPPIQTDPPEESEADSSDEEEEGGTSQFRPEEEFPMGIL